MSFTPLLDKQVRKRKKPVVLSWCMDETYIKLNGKWIYLYRAVDLLDNTIEFLLRKHSAKDNLAKDQKIEIRHNKYLNNTIEQDHRFIKKRTRPMLCFKNFESTKITITGIENIRMIQKGQIVGADSHFYAFKNFKCSWLHNA